MIVILSVLLPAVTSVDAQCTGDFPNFFEFDTAAGDTLVQGSGTGQVSLFSNVGSITIFGQSISELEASK